MQTFSRKFFFLIFCSIVITIQTGRQTRSNVYSCRHKDEEREKETNNSFLVFSQCQTLFSSGKDSKCIFYRHKYYTNSNLDKKIIRWYRPWIEGKLNKSIQSTFIFIDLHSNFKKQKDYFTKKGNNTHIYIYL
jgi:hypothetical protein